MMRLYKEYFVSELYLLQYRIDGNKTDRNMLKLDGSNFFNQLIEPYKNDHKGGNIIICITTYISTYNFKNSFLITKYIFSHLYI